MRRVTHSYRQHLNGTADRVFPLICPVRETEWFHGFEYDMVYSKSGVAEPDCVFTTSMPGEQDTVWTITRHDRDGGLVEFLRVTPASIVTRIEVRLAELSGGRCTADIRYIFTSLGPDGDVALAGRFSETGFMQMVKRWEDSLNHYLATGQTLQEMPANRG